MNLFKNAILSIVSFFSISVVAIAALPDVHILLNGVKTTVTGKAEYFEKNKPTRIVQTVLTEASAVSAVVTIDGSLDGTNWSNIGTMSVASSPAASQVASLAVTSPWAAMRAVVSGITTTSGAAATSAAVVTTMVAE